MRSARVAWLLIAVAAAACDQGEPGTGAAPETASGAEAAAETETAPASDNARARPDPDGADNASTRPDPDGADNARTSPDSGNGTAGPDPVAEVMAMEPGRSTSVGGPRYGRLEGGVALPMGGPGFRFNPRRREEARYGTVETVRALIRAAKVVHERMPGGELTVNDLSHEQGGPIPHHGSHRSGRDVDTLFYLLGPDGEPLPSVGAFLDPRGRGVDFKDLADPGDDVPVRIDLPRTWLFVQALIEDPETELQRIYVVEHLRSMLLEHARETDAPDEVVRRFELITCQPSYPHDDHFHFRFFCAPQDIREGCEDTLPLYPWHRRTLAEADVEPTIERKKRRAPRPKLTTPEEAREQAGPMHADVEDWLDRREAWLDKPRTGRPYCR